MTNDPNLISIIRVLGDKLEILHLDSPLPKEIQLDFKPIQLKVSGVGINTAHLRTVHPFTASHRFVVLIKVQCIEADGSKFAVDEIGGEVGAPLKDLVRGETELDMNMLPIKGGDDLRVLTECIHSICQRRLL